MAFAQGRYGAHWTIGYDTSLIDPGGDVILMDFNIQPVQVQTVKTVDKFSAFGSVSIMSDAEGRLIFYTSGCYVVNAAHEIMENGDTINPGYIQENDCPFGDSNNIGGAIAIPWPDSANLYLLFVNDYEWSDFPGEPFGAGSSRHLHYNVIDMTKDGGLGAVTLKNQVAIVDTMAPCSIEACRHANGRDWWVLAPKTLTNCYFLTLVTPQGVGTPQLVCTGTPWSKKDETGQSFFTPNGEKFVRFDRYNGIHIYKFDNETGILSNETLIGVNDFVQSSAMGVAVSPNSRYLYVGALTQLFQYDLEAPDIASSRVLLAVPDNVPDPFVPSVFTLCGLGPDGKIYISSGSTHLSLHVIHRPDCPGLYSLPERRGLKLTSWNYFGMPNMPNFRNEPFNSPCDSMVVQTYTPVDGSKDVVVYPNPASDKITVFVNHPVPRHSKWILYDPFGTVVRQVELEALGAEYEISLGGLLPGIFYYEIRTLGGRTMQRGRLAVIQ